MKKLKLFPKTFLYTLCLMLIIVLISHLIIYFLLPVVYNFGQESNLKKDITDLIKKITEVKDEERLILVSEYASKWNANILVNYDGFSYEMNILGNLSEDIVNLQTGTINATIVTEESNDGIRISLAKNLQGGADFFHIEESFGDGKGYIVVFASRQQIENAINSVVVILPFTAIICILISTVFALFYSRTLTKPIAQISKATEKMKNLQPNTFCSINTDDEIGLLASNINSLYQTLLETIRNLEQEIHKVENAETQKIYFLRTASHELKTPVTAVNVMLENMILNVGKYKDRDVYLAKCKVMTENLATMIKEILDISKLDIYGKQELVEIDIANIVKSVCEPFSVIAKSNDIKFNVNISNSFKVQFAIGKLELVISNLLSNAVSYTQKGGAIWIYFNEREIVIENECEVIPPEQLTRIFEAFYRPDYGRGTNNGRKWIRTIYCFFNFENSRSFI